MPVPTWQIVVPIAALVVLGYTLYRNVVPYPDSGPRDGSRSWPAAGLDRGLRSCRRRAAGRAAAGAGAALSAAELGARQEEVGSW